MQHDLDTLDERLAPPMPPETPEEVTARHTMQSEYAERETTLTEEQVEFISNKLGSKLWRLSNIYTILDKDGVKKILRLNGAQKKVIKLFKHIKKIILKSRQQGISTLYLAYNLDDCLFKPGYQAGIQSYGQDEAEKLSKRAQLMWDDLDQNIKDMFDLKLVANNSKGMTFSNGSILKICNFRGDTLQALHVSELAKIAKRYPEKAKELKTGAFQAVGKNNKITIESTAEGKSGLFYEIWNKAMIKLKLSGLVINTETDQELGPFDFQPIFLSWLEDPDCNIDIKPADIVMEESGEYLDKLEVKLGITLEDTQRYWYSAKADELGEDMKQEYPSYPDEAFEQSVEGTYYKVQYQRMLKEERIKKLKYNRKYPVYAIFDLGVNDLMAINFVQVINGKPKVIFEYSNTGQSIEYYVHIMRALPFNIDWVYLPHDANVTEMQTGRTRYEEFMRLGVRCSILDKQSLQDGINAARQYLKVVEIDEECIDTIDSVQNYRKKYDKRLGVYLGTPEHDKYSHFADVIRYSALALTYSKVKSTEELEDEEEEDEIDDADYEGV